MARTILIAVLRGVALASFTLLAYRLVGHSNTTMPESLLHLVAFIYCLPALLGLSYKRDSTALERTSKSGKMEKMK